MKRLIYIAVLMMIGMVGCTEQGYEKEQAYQPENYRRAVQQLTDIIVFDIFSPPQASRNYTYPSIAAYEVMAQDSNQYLSLEGQVSDLKNVPQIDPSLSYCLPLAAFQAYISTGRHFIFSEAKMNDFEAKIYAEYKAIGIPQDIFARSTAFGKEMAAHIIAWSDGDNYKETRTAPRYEVVSDQAGRWAPTPPDYMDGIEPHWSSIRPFVIDSATQFAPVPPPSFSMDKSSKFYKDLMEVYDVGKEIEQKADKDSSAAEKLAIAQFWDCNPYATQHYGHVMFATKKITPGGHWQGITAIATRQAESDFAETVHAYMRVSIALADGFISCWDEKYRSNLIRPETVINQHIDEDWRPVLQTPPFPEYTSGHSVISAAAAEALTAIYGDGFAFNDTSELLYGLPARSYPSFRAASEEAAISRLYGGIHYMPAIAEGVTQGRKVGNYIIEHLKTEEEVEAISKK